MSNNVVFEKEKMHQVLTKEIDGQKAFFLISRMWDLGVLPKHISSLMESSLQIGINRQGRQTSLIMLT